MSNSELLRIKNKQNLIKNKRLQAVNIKYNKRPNDRFGLNFCPSPQVDGRIILTDIFILHFHLKKAWVLSIYSIIFNKFRHICCDI